MRLARHGNRWFVGSPANPPDSWDRPPAPAAISDAANSGGRSLLSFWSAARAHRSRPSQSRAIHLPRRSWWICGGIHIPPLNIWILAGLLAVFGDVYEVPFHAFYILFSLIAAIEHVVARDSDSPTGRSGRRCCFFPSPRFVVNGNSLEADLPFLAFWMAGIALFVADRFALAALALALAAMTAYQAIVATPILFVYCWLHARRSRIAWAVALTPVIVVAGYQLYERATSGALPADRPGRLFF